MTFNRAYIMQQAWTIARRFAGNSETWGQRLSRALKSVWQAVKDAARIKAEVARKLARFADWSVAALEAAIIDRENTDRLGWAGQEELGAMRRELTARRALV